MNDKYDDEYTNHPSADETYKFMTEPEEQSTQTNTSVEAPGYDIENDDELEDDSSQSPVEKVVDFVKGNILYVVVAAVLIVPAISFFKSEFIDTGPAAPVILDPADLSITADEDNPYINTRSVTRDDPARNVTTDSDVNSTVVDETSMGGFEGGFANEQNIADMSNVPVDNIDATDMNNVTGSQFVSEDLTANNVEQQLLAEQIAILNEQLASIENALNIIGDNQQVIQQEMLQSSTQQQQLQATDEKIDSLTNNVNNLGRSLNSLARNMIQTNLPQPQMSPINNSSVDTTGQAQDFVVHAIIPGRAWLRNQQGGLLTARVGEQIPGYGRVVRIDPHIGLVALDTNIIFTEENS